MIWTVSNWSQDLLHLSHVDIKQNNKKQTHQTNIFTSSSPFFFVCAPSVLWPSETGVELTSSVLEACGSDVALQDCDGTCSWYRRVLSFSSKVLIVQSTNSTLRGPSLSDSPRPLAVCCWLDCWEVWGAWCAGLWGCDATDPGCIDKAKGCCKTTGWWEASWGAISPVELVLWVSWFIWEEATLPGTPLSLAFTSRETGGTIAQHGISVTIETGEIQGSSTRRECVWLRLAGVRVSFVTLDCGCWTWALLVFWSCGCTGILSAGAREEEDGLWEDTDATGVDTAALLVVGLTDDTEFSDSKQIKTKL